MEGNMEMKEWTVVSRRRPGKKGDIDLTPTSKDARHSVVLRRVGTAPKGPAAPKGTKNKPPTDAVANSAATASKASKISWAVRSKQTVQSAKAGNTTRSKKARQAHPAQSLNSGSSSARAGPGQKKGSTYTPGSSFSIKVAKPKKAAETAASWGTDPKLNPPLDAAEAALCRLKQLKRAIRVGTIGQKDRARSGNYPMSSSRTYGHTMDQKRQASKARDREIPVKRSITSLKKAILRERVSKWLSIHNANQQTTAGSAVTSPPADESTTPSAPEAVAAPDASKASSSASQNGASDVDCINNAAAVIPSTSDEPTAPDHSSQPLPQAAVASTPAPAPAPAAAFAADAQHQLAPSSTATSDPADAAPLPAEVKSVIAALPDQITRRTDSREIKRLTPFPVPERGPGKGKRRSKKGGGKAAAGQAGSGSTVAAAPAIPEYADHTETPELKKMVEQMISTLYFFQERLRQQDPVKAKLRRRLVMGLREVDRRARTGRLAAVIVSTSIKESDVVMEHVHTIIKNAREHGIPLIFALSQRQLGRALGKTLRTTIIGVLSFDGLNGLEKDMLALVDRLRAQAAHPAVSTDDSATTSSTAPARVHATASGGGAGSDGVHSRSSTASGASGATARAVAGLLSRAQTQPTSVHPAGPAAAPAPPVPSSTSSVPRELGLYSNSPAVRPPGPGSSLSADASIVTNASTDYATSPLIHAVDAPPLTTPPSGTPAEADQAGSASQAATAAKYRWNVAAPAFVPGVAVASTVVPDSQATSASTKGMSSAATPFVPSAAAAAQPAKR